jgi:membrane associated rhomboid family serine protease
VLVAVHAAFAWTSPSPQELILRDFAFIPGRLTVAYWPARAIDLLIRARTDPAALAQAREMWALRAMSGGPKLWTLLTYAFLHGSWTHVLLNTVWLFAFGPPVARRFGAGRLLLFMATAAILSALAQWASTPMEFAPLIGASGAVSGLMGAATRFVFRPGAPLGPASLRRAEMEAVPPDTLRGILLEPRARVFLVLWFATNFVFGAFAQPLGLSDAPVAWVAHVGGFLAGLLLFPLFDRRRSR